MSLTEFLLARIAEDEDPESYPELSGDPERVVRECEAKRRIVEAYGEPLILFGGVESWHFCLRPLAAIYADHPDYDPGWKP